MKSDVTEELDRLRAHVQAARALLAEAEPVPVLLDLELPFLRPARFVLGAAGGYGFREPRWVGGKRNHRATREADFSGEDDGGSSGVLRRELGVQPPGDIRNCLAALATEEPLLTRLFQYRFRAGTGLEGHSFGNLFLSALTAITGSLESAITASSRVLAVQGTVVPATNADVRLWAELEDGRRIEGESQIGHASSPIVRLGCTPERPPALPRALEAIANADLIVLGPGSLYTSLLPNLLVPELVIAFMKDLQAEGVAFALDDFGSGYTAIRYFKDFFFDILKIDGQFIRNIHRDPDNAFRGWNDAWLDPGFRSWNVGDVIDYFRLPTLAIQGRQDQYGTLAQIAEVETRSYAPVEVAVLEDCRHAPHQDKPEEVLEVVASFCARLERIEAAEVSLG